MNHLIVSWEPFQRRMESMAFYLSLDKAYLGARGPKWAKPWLYLSKTIRTFYYCYRGDYSIVILQLPPIFLLHAALLYRAIRRCFGARVLVVADCHNGQITGYWARLPGSTYFLNKSDLILLHNEDLLASSRLLGLDESKTYILEDPPSKVENTATIDPIDFIDRLPRPWLVVPCSFREDEPIGELFEAASRIPGIHFLITGDNARLARHGELCCPENITLTGFLSRSVFDSVLIAADGVVGLTKNENVQISVANEAIGAGKPLLLNRTSTLEKIFGDGACFARSYRTDDLESGLKYFISNLDLYEEKSRLHRVVRQERWAAQLKLIPHLARTLRHSGKQQSDVS